MDEEWAWCPECGAAHQTVRPGKTQPTCRCDERCHRHGPRMIAYHPEGEFQNVSGYFCAACADEDGWPRRSQADAPHPPSETEPTGPHRMQGETG